MEKRIDALTGRQKGRTMYLKRDSEIKRKRNRDRKGGPTATQTLKRTNERSDRKREVRKQMIQKEREGCLK